MIAVGMVMVSCENKPKRDVDEKPREPKEPTVEVERPRETITIERAQAMYKAYQKRYDALTKFRDGKEDSRYGWHSVEFYENYIAFLKQEAKRVGMEISGIRMYYVAYPEDEMSGDQRGYQTFFYVPTYYDKEKKKHVAFDPLNMDDDGRPLPIHEIITKGTRGRKELKSGILSVAKSANERVSSIANMAEMCEPNCN